MMAARVPDAVLDLDEDAYLLGDDNCAVGDVRFFLRGELAHGGRTYAIWVEVERKAYKRALALWRTERALAEPPLEGTLANGLPDEPTMLGRPAALSWQRGARRPTVTLR